jgi:7-cyano-7-deazaguanine reductase
MRKRQPFNAAVVVCVVCACCLVHEGAESARMIASRLPSNPLLAMPRSSRGAGAARPALPKPATPPSAPSKDLQVFANPAPERDYVIRFDVPEFTCLCPLTGQPDFAHFQIEYVPDKLCVELKSLKMYFWSFRNEGAFHEKVTNAIVDDIARAIKPRFLRLAADWFVRGGIRTYVTAEHRKQGWMPAMRIELPPAP